MTIGPRLDLFSSALTAMRSGEGQIVRAMEPLVDGNLEALPDSMLGLSLGKATFKVGVLLVQTADDLYRSTLDLLA